MVRELHFDVDFPCCTPQEFFDVIFADETTTKIYHKLNSSKDGATVSEWENSHRTVQFRKDLQLPKALAAVIGCDSIPITEQQTLEWITEDEFRVTSAPEFGLSVGPALSGSTSITVRPRDGGSQLAIEIACATSGPWGMVGMIESYMAKEAKEGVDAFLIFCETRIAESKLEMSSSENNDSDTVEFYDVQYETYSQFSTSDLTSTDNREAFDTLTPDTIILSHLKRLEDELRASTQNTERLLQRLQSMESSLLRYQRLSTYAVLGCCACSFAMATTILFLRKSGN